MKKAAVYLSGVETRCGMVPRQKKGDDRDARVYGDERPGGKDVLDRVGEPDPGAGANHGAGSVRGGSPGAAGTIQVGAAGGGGCPGGLPQRPGSAASIDDHLRHDHRATTARAESAATVRESHPAALRQA